MDDFVCQKLEEWGLSEYIETLKEHKVDKESLFCLNNTLICELIPEIGSRAKFINKLEQLKTEQELKKTAESARIFSSSSGANKTGKRKSKRSPNASKRRRVSDSEERLSPVNKIMNDVQRSLPDNKISNILKRKISDLTTERRELVGVFGKTGAGKSTLINAIIGEKNLLPTGKSISCTTVMIKVEANDTNDSKYKAYIEFIDPQEWLDEFWSFETLQNNDDDDDDDDDDEDMKEKLKALYGQDWKGKVNHKNCNDRKHFREILEFLESETMHLTCDSAEELSEKIATFTRNSQDADKKQYWPLVKCVTLKLPNFFPHVTIVDIPGNGDRNKSRDKMWKELVGKCSTIWIVAEASRSVAEKEAWEILTNSCNLMGNGGECRQIHFICTKCDDPGNLDEASGTASEKLLKENQKTKDLIMSDIAKRGYFKNHFNEDCFKVFTVSARTFLHKTYEKEEDTEIPALKDFLKNLFDRHSETLNYVSRAHGILCLIQGARNSKSKNDMYRDLETTLRSELAGLKKRMEEACAVFETGLVEGVKESLSSWEKTVTKEIRIKPGKGRGFHKILKCLVNHNGAFSSKNRFAKNLNVILSSWLTGSIDVKFKETFPNERKRGPFNNALKEFTLGIEKLAQKYKKEELQLIFLKTEEEKVKDELNKSIQDRKKTIYNSLTEKIEENMQECYEAAKQEKGEGSMKKMQDIILQHIRKKQDTMFEEAKGEMLKQLVDLKDDILMELEERLRESMRLSSKTDSGSLPALSSELDEVKKILSELKGSPSE